MPRSNPKSVWGVLSAAARVGVFHLVGPDAPVNGDTGKKVAGKGCLYTNHNTGQLFKNTGTSDNPTWVEIT